MRGMLGPIAGQGALTYLAWDAAQIPSKMVGSVYDIQMSNAQAQQQISTGSYGFSQAYARTAYLESTQDRFMMNTPLRFSPIVAGCLENRMQARQVEDAQRSAATTEAIQAA